MADFTTSALAWLRQSTTGQGGAAVIGTALALMGHQISIESALPVFAAGALLIVFPQAPSGVAPAVEKTLTDGEALVGAFRDGTSHGLSAVQAAAAAIPQAQPIAADFGALVNALHANTAATKESSAGMAATSPLAGSVTGA